MPLAAGESHALPGNFDVRVSANLPARSWFLRSCQRSSSSLSRKPTYQRTSLEGFDIALFARSCESADELELFNYSSSMRLPQQGSHSSRKDAGESFNPLALQRVSHGGEPTPSCWVPRQAGTPPQPQRLLHRHPLPLPPHGKKHGQQSSALREPQNSGAALKKITRQSCLTQKSSPAPACWPSLPRWWQKRRLGGCRGAFA